MSEDICDVLEGAVEEMSRDQGRYQEAEGKAERLEADLAAAVELLKRVDQQCGMPTVLEEDVRVFLDAVEKRAGGGR